MNVAATDLREQRDLQSLLSQRIKNVLMPLLAGRAERVHLIDPPDHPNVGDCAILLGELDFFARELPQSRLRFHDFTTYTPASRSQIEHSSVLAIHGGGNFGDIWPHHHQFRLEIIRQFRNRPIIQLPQSIHFDSADALKETQIAIAAHPDFTLLVRDTTSEAFAKSHFDCEIRLCPDMAFAMNPIQRKKPEVDAFCLLRKDKEAVAPHEAIRQTLLNSGLSVETGDWLEDFWTYARRMDRFLSMATRKRPETFPFIAPIATIARERYARARLNIGIDMLSKGSIVVCDRLHAHILSTILGIPNVVFRSFDTKISAFHETWTHRYPMCRLVENPDELAHAVAEVRSLR